MLSDKLRPYTEVAPWVIREVKALETELAATQAELVQVREWVTRAPHLPHCYRLDTFDERDHGCTCGQENILAEPHQSHAALTKMLKNAKREGMTHLISVFFTGDSVVRTLLLKFVSDRFDEK